MLRHLVSLLFSCFGWRIIGNIDKKIKKCVIIIAPHTSYWDFIVGVQVRYILKIKARFLIKDDFFTNPISSYFFNKLGGVPVNRKGNSTVDQAVDIFEKRSELMIAIAPEGTRAKVDKLKTGFYRIASRARVPIIMAALDYKTKSVVFLDPFWTSDNQEEDMKNVLDSFKAFTGYHPELGL